MAMPLDFSLFLIKNQSVEKVCSSLERRKTKTKLHYLNVHGSKDNYLLGKTFVLGPAKLIKWLVNDYRCNLETKDIRAMT